MGIRNGLLEDILAAIEAGGGGGTSTFGEWLFDATNQSPPAGVGDFKLNNSDPLLATEVYINHVNSTGQDQKNLLNFGVVAGDTILLQKETDANVVISGEVQSSTDNGTYNTIVISNVQANGTFTDNDSFSLVSRSAGLSPEQINKIENSLLKSQFRPKEFPVNIFGYTNERAGADAALQGWTQIVGGSVFFDTLINANVYRLLDNFGSDASQAYYNLSVDQWRQISERGVNQLVDVRTNDGVNNDQTAVWFGFSAATNNTLQSEGLGWPSVTRGAWRMYFDRDNGVQNLRIADGVGAGTFTLPEGYNRILLLLDGDSSVTASLYLDEYNPDDPSENLITTVDLYQHANDYSDDRVTIGSGTGSGAGADFLMRNYQFSALYADPVLNFTLEDFVENNYLAIPPYVTDVTVNLTGDATAVPFNALMYINAKNTGDVIVQRPSGSENVVIDGSASQTFKVRGTTKEIVLQQISYNDDGDGVAGIQFFSRESLTSSDVTQVASEVTPGDLMVYNPVSNELEPAKLGAKIGDSQAITQDVNSNVIASTVSATFSVSRETLNLTALAINNGTVFTLDFGDPSDIELGSVKEQRLYVEPDSGSTIRLQLDSPYEWRDFSSQFIDISEPAEVLVNLYNRTDGVGGVAIITPLKHAERKKSEVVWNGLTGVSIPTVGQVDLIALLNATPPTSGSLAPYFNVSSNKINVYNANASMDFKLLLNGTFSGSAANRGIQLTFDGSFNALTVDRSSSAPNSPVNLFTSISVDKGGNFAVNGSQLKVQAFGSSFNVTDAVLIAEQVTNETDINIV